MSPIIPPHLSIAVLISLAVAAGGVAAQPVPPQTTTAPAVDIATETPLREVQKLIGAGELVRALARADAHIAKHPRDAQMRFVRGVILTELKEVDAARAVFVGLAEDFPELPEPHNNLAVLYAAEGQLELARGALEMALTARPDYATARENLGDVYLQMAADAYERAAKLQPANRPLASKLGLTRELIIKAGVAR
jgi:Flp pilus assembly protein TadD